MPSSRRSSLSWVGSRWSIIGAFLLPLGLSVAWIPLRTQLPDVDVALALVLAVTASGVTGRPSSVCVAAAVAAGGFAFFDTRPYEHWDVSRQPDLETLLVLAVVSLVTGQLAVRTVRLRARSGSDDGMQSVREVASLVASGAELVTVITAVGEDLVGLLCGQGWTYEAGEPVVGTAVVGRDGTVTPFSPVGPRVPAMGTMRSSVDRILPTPTEVEVPVSGMGRILGRYVIGSIDDAPTDVDTLLLALTLADQVGAALIAQAPETAAASDDPLRPTPILRLLE